MKHDKIILLVGHTESHSPEEIAAQIEGVLET